MLNSRDRVIRREIYCISFGGLRKKKNFPVSISCSDYARFTRFFYTPYVPKKKERALPPKHFHTASFRSQRFSLLPTILPDAASSSFGKPINHAVCRCTNQI